MNPEVLALIKGFEPDSKKPKERYAEFLAYCYYNLDRMINKYKFKDFDRELLIKYILAHKVEITAELSK
jgi:endonuclease YncB( thermonuclease family)